MPSPQTVRDFIEARGVSVDWIHHPIGGSETITSVKALLPDVKDQAIDGISVISGDLIAVVAALTAPEEPSPESHLIGENGKKRLVKAVGRRYFRGELTSYELLTRG